MIRLRRSDRLVDFKPTPQDMKRGEPPIEAFVNHFCLLDEETLDVAVEAPVRGWALQQANNSW